MATYKFNDRQGNRDRSCHYAILHEGKVYDSSEAESLHLAVFKQVNYKKDGKWSCSDWEVVTKTATLIICMSPFNYWSDDLTECIEHVQNSCEGYIGYRPTVEEAELFFRSQYPKTYAKKLEKSQMESELI